MEAEEDNDAIESYVAPDCARHGSSGYGPLERMPKKATTNMCMKRTHVWRT